MEELISVLGRLATDLGQLLVLLLGLALRCWSLLLFWVAWWLWGVNWNKAWGYLQAGAWVPLVLISLLTALVWSGVAPGNCTCLPFVTVPNF